MIVSAVLRLVAMQSDLADPGHAVTVGKLLNDFNASEFGLPSRGLRKSSAEDGIDE
jgi:hypothetical protein